MQSLTPIRSTSNSGGKTTTGSGPSRGYGGGAYYGGGATTPYRSGGRSPIGITPFIVAPLLIFPGLWLYSAYAYPYSHNYNFHNRTNPNNTDNTNTTLPVLCLCEEYSVCGCDDNNNSTFLDSIVGNGSYQGLNKTLATVASVKNETTGKNVTTLVLNGTLPNGTTAPGGTDSATASWAARNAVVEGMGWWVMTAVVLVTVSYV
jgi:hypothetical protein